MWRIDGERIAKEFVFGSKRIEKFSSMEMIFIRRSSLAIIRENIRNNYSKLRSRYDRSLFSLLLSAGLHGSRQ